VETRRRWAIAGATLVVAVGPAAVAAGQVPGGAQAAQAQPAREDVTFVRLATAGNLFEIRSGRLAETRAESDAVKRIARQIVRDHTRLQRAVETVARQLAIEVPQDPQGAAQRRDYQRLRERRGERFDELFLRVQIQAHRAAASFHVQAATDPGDARVTAAAARALPVIGSHLGMAEAVRDLREEDDDTAG
jgi:putative membrane protein